VLGCGLSDEGWGLYLWVAVTAGEEHGGGCTYINEREFHLTPVSAAVPNVKVKTRLNRANMPIFTLPMGQF